MPLGLFIVRVILGPLALVLLRPLAFWFSLFGVFGSSLLLQTFTGFAWALEPFPGFCFSIHQVIFIFRVPSTSFLFLIMSHAVVLFSILLVTLGTVIITSFMFSVGFMVVLFPFAAVGFLLFFLLVLLSG